MFKIDYKNIKPIYKQIKEQIKKNIIYSIKGKGNFISSDAKNILTIKQKLKILQETKKIINIISTLEEKDKKICIQKITQLLTNV